MLTHPDHLISPLVFIEVHVVLSFVSSYWTSVCCHIFVVGDCVPQFLYSWYGLPRQTARRIEVRQTGSTVSSLSFYFPIFLPFTFLLLYSFISPFSVLFSSIYNIFALLGLKAPFTHSLTLLIACDSLVFWILSFDCIFFLIAWYLYFFFTLRYDVNRMYLTATL